MNIIQLFEDYDVPYWTEGKNCSPGWVNTTCPWCDDTTNHLGFSSSQKRFHCWKCGAHQLVPTLTRLLHVKEGDIKSIIAQFGPLVIQKPAEPEVKIRLKSHRLPSDTNPLDSTHKKYLMKRGFDPDRLEEEWKLVGTGPLSSLDGIQYNYRIIAPIFWNGREVSFQARDITGKHILRYMACPKAREIIHHKHILYGKQEAWNEFGVVVEGITDVWRFGSMSICTFGVQYTQRQLREISRHFKRIAVVFDNERPAQKRSSQLVAELKFRGVDSFNVNIEGDPASMSQSDADYLIKQLF